MRYMTEGLREKCILKFKTFAMTLIIILTAMCTACADRNQAEHESTSGDISQQETTTQAVIEIEFPSHTSQADMEEAYNKYLCNRVKEQIEDLYGRIDCYVEYAVNEGKPAVTVNYDSRYVSMDDEKEKNIRKIVKDTFENVEDDNVIIQAW